MTNCAIKKQSTMKKVIDFPKCSIEFELRGANKKEFEARQKIVEEARNQPRLFELQALAKKAQIDNDYSAFDENLVSEYAKLEEEFTKLVNEVDFNLLVTCLTENKISTAGYKVVKGDVEFDDLNEVLSLLTPAQIEELTIIANDLTTIGNDEVAEEEVKSASEKPK